jgi:hypothetical protein
MCRPDRIKPVLTRSEQDRRFGGPRARDLLRPAVTGTEVGGGWYDAFWLYETISYVSEMRVTVA